MESMRGFSPCGHPSGQKFCTDLMAFLTSGRDVNTDRQAAGSVDIQELLRTNASWNAETYGAYPEGIA
jgi:hypothetical protein